jgi:hypothetical protein
MARCASIRMKLSASTRSPQEGRGVVRRALLCPPCAIAICIAIRPHIRANQACPAPTGLLFRATNGIGGKPAPSGYCDACVLRACLVPCRGNAVLPNIAAETCLSRACRLRRRLLTPVARSESPFHTTILHGRSCSRIALVRWFDWHLPDVYRQAATTARRLRGRRSGGTRFTRAAIAFGGKYECVTFPRQQPA